MDFSKVIQHSVTVVFTMAFPFVAFAEECKDGVCPLPAGGEATYTVLSPVPESAVEPQNQSFMDEGHLLKERFSRLSSLQNEYGTRTSASLVQSLNA